MTKRTGTDYSCGLCGDIFSTLKIGMHINHSHKISAQQYYDIMEPSELISLYEESIK